MTSRCVIAAVWLSLAVLTGCGESQTQAPSDANNTAAGENTHSDEQPQQAPGGEHEAQDEHAGDKPSRVHLTQAQRDQLDVRVAPAKAGSATATVSAPATVAFDSDRVARIGPRLSAKVLKVTADLGDEVDSGDTVAILDSVALGQAKAGYLTAVAHYGNALATYQRNRKLADDKIISDAKMRESRAKYESARAERNAAKAELGLYGLDEAAIDDISAGGDTPLSRYKLTTPIDGVVQQRELMPGQTVSANETPILVVDASRMWVMIEAFEKALPRLEPGQRVQLKVRALPGKTFTGATDWVSSELDEQSRTVRVRAVVANDNGLLRAGMFGTARIQTDAEQRFALVPVDAVQTIDEQPTVFVPGDERGAFRAVTVQTGAESGGRIEIRRGLKPGDRLVTEGAFALKSAYTASGRSAAHGH